MLGLDGNGRGVSGKTEETGGTFEVSVIRLLLLGTCSWRLHLGHLRTWPIRDSGASKTSPHLEQLKLIIVKITSNIFQQKKTQNNVC